MRLSKSLVVVVSFAQATGCSFAVILLYYSSQVMIEQNISQGDPCS